MLNKVVVIPVAGAVALLIVYSIGQVTGLVVPGEVEAAIAVILSWAAAFMTPESKAKLEAYLNK